jgi:molybdopterin biosynthesis enzyme
LKVRYFKTEEAVNHVLCHDITKIEKGKFKGVLYKKGHRISEEDVAALLDLGKYHVAAVELAPDELHEEEAGLRIAAALQGEGLIAGAPSEGRVDLTAGRRGLLKVDAAKLNRINMIPNVVVSTLHTNTHVEAGEKVAGTKVIPLVVKKKLVERVEAACAGGAPLTVLPYRQLLPGAVITGREVVDGRTGDGFAPVLGEKAAFFGLPEPRVVFAGDHRDEIAARINELIDSDCNLVVVTGGMSVDPDDVTPAAIRKAGARVVRYGAPALPGAMFMLAYKGEVPVVGLPACAMYFRITVLDLILPRILAGEKIRARDIAGLGHGGLCRRCSRCVFPNCSFGKVSF